MVLGSMAPLALGCVVEAVLVGQVAAVFLAGCASHFMIEGER